MVDCTAMDLDGNELATTSAESATDSEKVAKNACTMKLLSESDYPDDLQIVFD